MEYSNYQVGIFNFVTEGAGSAIVEAKAGAGKTTSIVKACELIPSGKSILFLAFNTKIVKELTARLPSEVNCLTFNSCGWRAWVKHTGKSYRQIRIDSKKTWRIIWDNFEPEDQRAYGKFVNKLVSLAKSMGLTPESSYREWASLSDYHSLELGNVDSTYERGIELSKRTLAYSIEISDFVCDFDDQLYMPWLHAISMNKYDVIFVDEAQDTNPIQLELVSNMLNDNGRVIAVGDPSQSIYGFRGADSNAMDNIKNKFDCEVLPLSISYRCCKAVVREAQAYVPDIRHFEGAVEGEVACLSEYSIDTFSDSDAVLCRNNAPLIELAYQFISRGKGVNFLGRDLGAGLQSLIKSLEATNLDHLSELLGKWLEKESEKLARRGNDHAIGALEDKVNCIYTFIRYLPRTSRTVSGLVSAIKELFRPKNRGITLSSVHKSKGREWDRVFILGFNKYMPSKYAKKDWQKVQEKNLIYVAITRAKNYLGYINEDEWSDVAHIPKAPSIKEKSSKPLRGRKNSSKRILSGFKP